MKIYKCQVYLVGYLKYLLNGYSGIVLVFLDYKIIWAYWHKCTDKNI